MRKISLIVLFSLILTAIFPIMGFAETKDETIIKIGLQYTSIDSQETKALVTIKGNSPFEFGELIDGKYYTHFQTDITSFSFDKDTGFHAVSGPFSSYEEALIYTSFGGFIVKKDDYYLYSQSASETTAQSEVTRLNNNGLATVLEGPNSDLVVIRSGSTLLGFEADKDFIMAPSGGLVGSYSYYGETPYRGGFGAKRQNTNDISLINYLTMDEYLYGVVPREMSKSWPIEALKAQAIVARNFAVSNMNKFSHYGFNLDNTTNSQVYGGYKWEGPISNQAVDETSGLVLKHDQAIVNAFYHSNSGGYTANSEDVFSSPLAYIKGVYDPFSLGAPNDTWTLNYSKAFIEGKLKDYGYNIGSLKEFYISEYTAHNRVFKAAFIGSSSTAILPKQDIRKVFGYNEVKSTLLTVVPDNAITITDGSGFYEKGPSTVSVLSGDGSISNLSAEVEIAGSNQNHKVKSTADNYTIAGKGWGHGLGMSQWGAKKMAESGFDYEQILTFYYTNTHIE